MICVIDVIIIVNDMCHRCDNYIVNDMCYRCDNYSQ